jgi:hypothetical protein
MSKSVPRVLVDGRKLCVGLSCSCLHVTPSTHRFNPMIMSRWKKTYPHPSTHQLRPETGLRAALFTRRRHCRLDEYGQPEVESNGLARRVPASAPRRSWRLMDCGWRIASALDVAVRGGGVQAGNPVCYLHPQMNASLLKSARWALTSGVLQRKWVLLGCSIVRYEFWALTSALMDLVRTEAIQRFPHLEKNYELFNPGKWRSEEGNIRIQRIPVFDGKGTVVGSRPIAAFVALDVVNVVDLNRGGA